jgi:hypothetical protein
LGIEKRTADNKFHRDYIAAKFVIIRGVAAIATRVLICANGLSGINPCATKRPAKCHVAQGFSPVDNWKLNIDNWIFDYFN